MSTPLQFLVKLIIPSISAEARFDSNRGEACPRNNLLPDAGFI